MRKIPNYGSSIVNASEQRSVKRFKKVVDIIRDANHPLYKNPNDIGRVFFRDEKAGGEVSSALPKDRNLTRIPLIGEIIEIDSALDGNNYYPELGGNINSIENFYSNPISVHNSTGNNSLPSPDLDPLSYNAPLSNIQGAPPGFNFKQEFISPSRESARRELDEYLYSLGYTSGRDDPRAPTYALFQKPNGDYVFRLEDSRSNNKKEKKLGNYFKENPNARPLKLNEGDVAFQGRNRQSIQFTSTTPQGESPWSSGVTDVPDDGNPNIGDPAMILRIGHPYNYRGELEEPNINEDASSIYMFSNQKLDNFIPADDNIDSLKSTYEKIQDPYSIISEPPVVDVVVDNNLALEPPNQNIFNEESSTIEEPVSSYEVTSSIVLPEEDPVFDALNESANEGLLSYQEYEYDDADFEVIYGDKVIPDTFIPDYVADLDLNYNEAPPFDFSSTDVSYLGRSNFIYPTTHGKLGNTPGKDPYPGIGWGEFGGFRGIYDGGASKGKWRYHWGVDIVPLDRNNPSIPLLAITDADVMVVRGAGGSNSGFTCADGAQNKCGGFYGNHIIIRFKFNPNFAALYAHCKFGSNRFKKGDRVKRGEVIANLGNSGRSTGPHLHFEIIEDPTGKQFNADNGGWYNKAWKRNPQSIFPLLRRNQSYDFR
jgi:murein DD-endopeptidase MepM/ murein hydrolase activator NlpD